MNLDATTNELLMDLFENYDMESIIEQLKNSVVVNDNFNNEEGGINFISSQVGKQSDVHIDKSEEYHFETEDKFIFDDPDRNYEDISLQNIESDLVSEDEDHYHVNEGFLPTEGSISETVRKDRQIEGNYLDMTLLEEGHVTEIEEQPDIKWSKKISSTEKDEIISETMGSQNIDSIETAIKHEFIYNTHSADIEETIKNSDKYSLINDFSSFQTDFTPTQEGFADIRRTPDETNILDSSTVMETNTMDSIKQHNSV